MVTRNMVLAASLFALALPACSGAADGDGAEQDMSAAFANYSAEVSATEAAEMISQSPDLVVVDVRTPEEFAQGHIEGAINLNLRSENFAQELAKLDRERTYVLHCKSGARSAQALEVMKEQDFKSIVHMADGFDGWQAAGLETAQ